MPKKFYIADWHYGHANCVAFDNRPFRDVDEMNKALINNWNKVVGKDDIVYILGDMFWCKPIDAIPVLDMLNGQKILIKGNHDGVNNSEFKKRFVKITDYLEVQDDDKNIVLCHYPIPCFKNHFYGWYHLYGHVHRSFEHNMMEHSRYLMRSLYQKQCLMFNVGAMMPYINYTPRTLSEIISANIASGEISIEEIT